MLLRHLITLIIDAHPRAQNAQLSKNGGASRNRTDDILLAKQTLYQLSYGPSGSVQMEMVGQGRLELPTSRLSGVRSNRLSYRP
ncbi:unnamed protein product, partial [Ectocarpus sp. 12 AP-2014]